MDKRLQAFERLLNIMDDLREQCPWDKKQTIQSLRHLTIEETYELSDAIIENDMKGIKEELGDLMLHNIFYAKIASETNDFNITEVLNQVCDKLIHRHPHIYGDVKVESEEEVKKNWEKLKLKEGKKSILEGVPKSLPAMTKAFRIQEKVKQVGFEWEQVDQVFDKVDEELLELKEAFELKNQSYIEDEMGDLFFALINLCRFLNVDPAKSLELTNKKFIRRFQWMEKYAKEHNLDLEVMTLEEMDDLWNKAKEV